MLCVHQDYCVSEGRLVELDSHPMCAPFAIPDDVQPLAGCVLCLSKYQEPERSHLVSLMDELGSWVCRQVRCCGKGVFTQNPVTA